MFYSLDSFDWEDWLTMDININSLEDFSNEEIIVTCIRNMTILGFTKSEFLENRTNYLKELTDCYMQADEGDDFISLENVLKNLSGGYDFGLNINTNRYDSLKQGYKKKISKINDKMIDNYIERR